MADRETAEEKLANLRELILNARAMPMSASCVINRGDVLAADPPAGRTAALLPARDAFDLHHYRPSNLLHRPTAGDHSGLGMGKPLARTARRLIPAAPRFEGSTGSSECTGDPESVARSRTRPGDRTSRPPDDGHCNAPRLPTGEIASEHRHTIGSGGTSGFALPPLSLVLRCAPNGAASNQTF